MREILFKAKRLDNGEWVQGYPFPNIGSKELTRMTVFDESDAGIVVNTYSVDPETVCQFTGVTDYNGVKIFEGDKCAFVSSSNSHKFFHTVYWEHTCCQYLMRDSGLGFIDALDVIVSARCVVIGNIYDKEETTNE